MAPRTCAVNSSISTSSTFQDKFTIDWLCSFDNTAVRCVQVDCSCFTRSFIVREHMQSHTGGTKTVNKGSWHHLGRHVEHICTKSQDSRGNLRHTLAKHKQFGAMCSYQIGYIAIGATPPCPAILDRQPAINVTSNVCQLQTEKGPEHVQKYVSWSNAMPQRQQGVERAADQCKMIGALADLTK